MIRLGVSIQMQTKSYGNDCDKYFQNLNCFKRGTNISTLSTMSNASLYGLKECPCVKGYYGPQCSIPGCVYQVAQNSKLIVPCLLSAINHHNLAGIPVNRSVFNWSLNIILQNIFHFKCYLIHDV